MLQEQKSYLRYWNRKREHTCAC